MCVVKVEWQTYMPYPYVFESVWFIVSDANDANTDGDDNDVCQTQKGSHNEIHLVIT